MPDATETVTEETTAETAAATEETQAPDLSAEVDKWKALSRKNEQRARDNESAAKRLAEIEDANKSELEKVLARAEAAEKAVAEATATALRASVANTKGVPLELLSGSTQEDLEASADKLLAFKGTAPKAGPSDGAGNVGSTIAGEKQITSREELKSMSPEQINKARAEGRLDTLMGK